MFYISPQLEGTGRNSLEKIQNLWTTQVKTEQVLIQFLAEWVSCAIYLMYFYSYRHELKMIGGSSTQILIKDDFELARLVQNSRKYMRANGWAPLGHAGHTNSTDRDDEEEEDEHAESGSLLENECFERESGLSRNEMSWYWKKWAGQSPIINVRRCPGQIQDAPDIIPL